MTYELGLIRTDRGQFIEKGNYAVDPCHADFAGGAVGDGLRDEVYAFQLADTHAQSAGANGEALGLVLRPGTYRLASNLTITSPVRMVKGALLKPASGVTLTINGAFAADLAQCFDLSLGGTVELAAASVSEVYPQWWGARGDGSTDDTDAIEAAIAAVNEPPNWGVYPAGSNAVRGPVVYFPPGTYRLTSQVSVARVVHLRGAGSNSQYSATILQWDAGTSGLAFAYGSAYGAQVSDIAIVSGSVTAQPTLGTCDGIYSNARIYLKNVYVRGWNRDGVRVSASVAAAPPDQGNANLFRFENVDVEYAGRHGFYITGNDANAGLIHACSALVCGGTGFNDETGIGNTYVMCHAAQCNQNYKLGIASTSNSSVAVGCYSEAGEIVPSALNQYASAFGGPHSFASGGTFGHSYIAALAAPASVLGDQLYRVRSGGKETWYLLGQTNADRPLRLGSAVDGSEIDWSYNDVATGAWMLSLLSGGVERPLLGLLPPAHASARNGVATLSLSYGALIGSVGRLLSCESAMPTTGSYQQGDYVLNSAPAVAGGAGSRYVVRGWTRLTTGSAHVLNTDWVEDRGLTGT